MEKLRGLFVDGIKSGDFKASTESAALFNESYQYKAVSCFFTDSPGALFHLKCMIAPILERMEKWNRTDDAVQLADAYNESAMAYMRDKTQADKTIAAWIQSYHAFGAMPGGDELEIKIRQEWPAVHLAIMYALRNEPDKGEEILLPVLKAREEKFGKDSTSSMVSGKVLHALGDICRAQGESDEAIELFQRALAIFRASIGNNHSITADARYCLAEHLVVTKPAPEELTLIKEWKLHQFSLLLRQRLKVYGNIRWYKRQAARSAFMLGKLLFKTGNTV
ncbi:hypothetical protein B0H63DRAFT_522686 [Podospora didyma]|uniref:Tetratricopeptide repeat protein n=1 Tax=Podospora didyma TaxID=330526 RepID=A0AAE0NPL9_9PEZI|nr:hypothetical protein B0H63DRAFT_522686 [Podospora didyma]